MVYNGGIGNQALAGKIDGFVIVICVSIFAFFFFLSQDRLGYLGPNWNKEVTSLTGPKIYIPKYYD